MKRRRRRNPGQAEIKMPFIPPNVQLADLF
jgi:hypothetical protein